MVFTFDMQDLTEMSGLFLADLLVQKLTSYTTYNNSKKNYIQVLYEYRSKIMLKINPKLQKNIHQYFSKNTVRAKYNRNMDVALVSGLVSAGETVNFFGHCQPHDVAILATSLTLYCKTFTNAMKQLIKLQPIRKRAIKIKKAGKIKN